MSLEFSKGADFKGHQWSLQWYNTRLVLRREPDFKRWGHNKVIRDLTPNAVILDGAQYHHIQPDKPWLHSKWISCNEPAKK